MAQEIDGGGNLSVPEPELSASPTPGPVIGTLDVDLLISKLLGFKDNPGKQVLYYAKTLSHGTSNNSFSNIKGK